MSSEHDAVMRVVDAFERSDWSEVDVRFGRLRVHLSTASSAAAPRAGSAPAGVESNEPDEPDEPIEESVDVSGAESPATSADPVVPPGAQLVVSPSPGIFWWSPEPGAPPFAAVGVRIEPSTTVGIVEVMKLMNHVKAGIAGEVVAVLVGNGEPVERGDALVAVLPGATGDDA